MTNMRIHRFATVLCAMMLPACSAPRPSANAPTLPPGVFGTYEDNAIGALNQSTWAFATPQRTHGNPIDAARAIVAVEYLADELRTPRWVRMSEASKAGMMRARSATRQTLGIRLDASPQPLVEELLRLTIALGASDQAAVTQILNGPVFTLPASQTLQILSDLPYIQSANVATLQASGEAFANGRN